MAKPTILETRDFLHAAHVALRITIVPFADIHTSLLQLNDAIRPQLHTSQAIDLCSRLDNLGQIHTALLDLSDAIENHLAAMKEPQ